ncbi:MAG: hypothetical protein DRR11_01105 [Gammaproteobacteria bacterium]|nr:MAG: hypothetical protein DRR11_01105 [Gammaproteobacteria bacterium]RLA36939.1 MAG: hypothetical protein DRR15_03430 [Gammaproteobacteria bacterium]
MKGKRFTEEQIIRILQEAEFGLSVADVCRKQRVACPWGTTARSNRFIAGKRSLVAWKSLRQNGCGSLNARTVN